MRYERHGHHAEEEGQVVNEIQNLRAQKKFAEADDLLVGLLDTYDHYAQKLARIISDNNNIDYDDAWFAARAVFADKILDQDPAQGRLDAWLTRPDIMLGTIQRQLRDTRGRGSKRYSRFDRAETNQLKKLADSADPYSQEYNDPQRRQVALQRAGFLARKMRGSLTEKQWAYWSRYFGLDNRQRETLEEIAQRFGVEKQAVDQLLIHVEKKFEALYEPPQYGEVLLSENDIRKYVDAIVTGLELASQHERLPATLRPYLWRYYNLDGYGRLNTVELGLELGMSTTTIAQGLRRARKIIQDILQRDQFVKDALDKLGLTRLGVDDLLLFFGDELRQRLKKKF